MGITRNQWFAIAILLLTVLTGGSAQLTDLIGPYATKLVISFSTLATGFLAGVQIILGGQGQQVKDVRNMVGVEHIEINDKANATLATMAMDPTENKIAPSQAAARQVQATATAAKEA